MTGPNSWNSLVFVDTETTGLNSADHQIGRFYERYEPHPRQKGNE